MNNTEKHLEASIFHSYFLKGIDDEIKNWNYNTVNGIGFYRKYTGHYSHIELEISKSLDENKRNRIKYSIDDNQLPKEFRIEIEETLSFFLSYLKAIITEEYGLVFNIIDGTYHPVDTRRTDFQIATVLALSNCFGKKIEPIKEKEIEIINKLKNDSLKR